MGYKRLGSSCGSEPQESAMTQTDVGSPRDYSAGDSSKGDEAGLATRAADKAAEEYASAENERRSNRFERAVRQAATDTAEPCA